MRYAFIEAELVLRVTQAGYHAWLKRPASLRAIERYALAELVKRVFAAFKGKYGAPRLSRELCKRYGYTGSYTRAQKLVKALGLKAEAGKELVLLYQLHQRIMIYGGM